jgi:hypothetical protein
MACGGKTRETGRTPSERGNAELDASAPVASQPWSNSDSDAGNSSVGQGSSGSESTFDDPGCPEIAEPEDDFQCDPLKGSDECGDGFGCYPYVDYPSEPCEAEQFGSICALAGTGEQGDPCLDQDCSAGFLCVASGQGTVCAQLCRAPGPNTCPNGLLCGSVDVKGFGVCF